jgi:hypothetical protein
VTSTVFTVHVAVLLLELLEEDEDEASTRCAAAPNGSP